MGQSQGCEEKEKWTIVSRPWTGARLDLPGPSHFVEKLRVV